MVSLEKIDILMKDDYDYSIELDKLLLNIKININNTRQLISNCSTILNSYEENLSEFIDGDLKDKISYAEIQNQAINFHKNLKKGFLFIPQIYTTTKIFLRNSWYKYESDM